MKFSATIFYLFTALIAVIPAQVAAGDSNGGGDNNGGDAAGNSKWKPQPPSSYPPDRNHPERPDHPDRDQWCDKKKPDGGDGKDYDKNKVQVLWGQCGGYYYYGTKNCPEGSYCRYFSDWYSQCNPNNN